MTLDNAAIARVLADIADLLELRGDNPFKIRAYRNAADAVATSPDLVGELGDERLRAWPGIGKDLSARIREIATQGTCALHQELLSVFPATLLDLLRLQGVGPKTVALLHKEMSISSLEDLEAAARRGALRTLKGMGARKEQLLLRALEDHRQRRSRHLLADAVDVGERVAAYLRDHVSDVHAGLVGSARRGVETCGDIDVLAVGTNPAVKAALSDSPQVERVLGHGETKVSVLMRGGYQVDMRLVAPESRGAALQYFTGSKAHNIALRDRALARGLRLNEYGVFRASDEVRLAGETEEDVYEVLGLPWIPPELREQRGELAAAEAAQLPRLITVDDLRGDLHMHTTDSDGRDSLEQMVNAARRKGLEYIAITDHSQALAMANGLDEARVMAQAARIRALDAASPGIRVLAGIECDILPDGTLDLSAECLASLDIVVASVHSALRQDEADMTARLIRAIEHPSVDVIGHPTCRLLLRREPVRVNLERVFEAASAHGVAFEINSQVDRLDLSDVAARSARDHGVKLVISSDAHATAALSLTRWGVLVARRAWATAGDVLNALPYPALRRALRRNGRQLS
ncbi:MAG: DNA polymerase/3'-5' exonuclease PolX [Acidobacteriota bacterium]